MLKEQLLLRCIDKTSGEWEFLSKREEEEKKAFVLTKKKHLLTQRLKEAKSYLNLCLSLLITPEIKTSPGWKKPTGLFYFS